MFLASSPRHVLLSAGLALEKGGENHLYFIEHVPAQDVTSYFDLFSRWKSSPFSSTTRLRGDYRPDLANSRGVVRRLRKEVLKRQYRRSNRRLIERTFRDLEPDNIFVGCDNFYEAQYALHFAKKMNPSTVGIYIEDGIGAYDNIIPRFRFRHFRDLVRKLSYGRWWKLCPVVGSSGWLEEGYVAFPELVIDELKKLRLHPLSREVFLTPEFGELARSMAEHFGVELDRLNDVSLVVIVTRSGVARFLPGYSETISRLCASVVAAGRKVAVKFHPRETEPGFIPLAQSPRVYIVPAPTMFELLLTIIDNPQVTVIGDMSSCMVATRWLRPGFRVIALRHKTTGVIGSYMEDVFAKLGVSVEDDHGSIPETYFPPQKPRLPGVSA